MSQIVILRPQQIKSFCPIAVWAVYKQNNRPLTKHTKGLRSQLLINRSDIYYHKNWVNIYVNLSIYNHCIDVFDRNFKLFYIFTYLTYKASLNLNGTCIMGISANEARIDSACNLWLHNKRFVAFVIPPNVETGRWKRPITPWEQRLPICSYNKTFLLTERIFWGRC